MNRTKNRWFNCGFRRRVASAALAVLPLAVAGCTFEQVETRYGKNGGVQGEASVNGTAILGRMFKRAGSTVRTRRWLSPSVAENSDVIVWFPDDLAPPDHETRFWLDEWLWSQPGRTLVYVGRDYDAAPDYWRAAIALSTAEQRPRLEESLRLAELDDKLRRNAYFSQPAVNAEADSADPTDGADQSDSGAMNEDPSIGDIFAERPADAWDESEYGLERWSDARGMIVPIDAPWFDVEPVEPHVDVRTLEGEGDWGDGVDASKLGVRLRSMLVPLESETLLSGDGHPLVMREAVGASQRIYVVNGSFLLNYSLVNHEHRRLAAQLIDEIGPHQRVTFLESGPGGPTIHDEDPQPQVADPLNIFRVYPMNFVLFQMAVLGGVFCLVRWSIFGRPQRVAQSSHADFAEHVQALGEMLSKRGDAADARQRLLHYKDPARHAAPRLSAAELAEPANAGK